MDVHDVVDTLDLAILKNHILQTSIVAWKHYITASSLERWQNNLSKIHPQKTPRGFLSEV